MKNQINGRSAKPPYMFYISLIVLCLTLITTNMSTGLLARYLTAGDSNAAARVASFDVSIGDTITKELKVTVNPGETVTQTITVQSNSEVAVRYTATVNTTGNLPLTFTWNGGATVNNNATATGTIAPNDSEERTLSLAIAWPKTENHCQYSTELDLITITVTCEQID